MTIVFLFIIGLCLGSFLGVVIDRLPKEKPFLVGRSECDSCHHVLSWYDLVPIFSYLFLRGKCRYCHKKLSITYPVFELSVGVILIGLFYFVGQPTTGTGLVTFLFQAGIFLSFIALSIIDIKDGILPDKIILFLLPMIVVFLFFTHSFTFQHILAGLGSCLLFFLIILLTQGRGMGMGDAKLALLLGLLLGWPTIVVAVYIAFIVGALVGLVLVICGKKKFHGGSIPFGPFLILGTVIAAFWGNQLWEVMLHVLGI